MKSVRNINNIPAGINISADELIEFHATRMLLLISGCGKKDSVSKTHKIEGLTKLAKLDFFVRYPDLFRKAANYVSATVNVTNDIVESKMIRFHYGPWDKRYYQVLPFLEARNLLAIEKKNNQYVFKLTEQGEAIAKRLSKMPSYYDLITKIGEVSGVFKDYNGNKLKTLIYDLFEDEVKNKEMDKLI